MARKASPNWWLAALYLLCIAMFYVGSIPLVIYGCGGEPDPSHLHPRVRLTWNQLRWIERHYVPDWWPPEYRRTVEVRVGWALAIPSLIGALLLRMLMPPRKRRGDWLE